MASPPGQIGLHIQRRSPLHKHWWLFHRALVSAYEDNCLGTAKAAAYSGLLAFFPLLTTVTAILVQANAVAVSRSLSNFLFIVVPPGTEEIVRYTLTQRGERPAMLLVLVTLLSLWGASGVMVSLMQGFQAAYRIPTGRPFLRQRGVAVMLVLSAALPMLGAAALIVFGERSEKAVVSWIGLLPEGQQLQGWISLMSFVARSVIALGAISFGASLLYYFGPNQPKRLRDVWPGAILSTFLWWGTTSAFAWYVRNIAEYNVLYGSIGAVIALLVWMYLLSIIALIGCEYNAERERLQAAGLPI